MLYRDDICDIWRGTLGEKVSIMRTLEANSVGKEELQKLEDLAEDLPDDSSLKLTLNDLSEAVREGSTTIISTGDVLTPAQAARLLRMSRSHLYKLLDAGDIPSTNVGRDRRIASSDLQAFIEKRDIECKQQAEQFAHSADARDRARALFN